MERGIHSNLISPTLRDKTTSFSSHEPNICEHHHATRCRGDFDHESTSELSIFNAHKYYNQVNNNNDLYQKVTIHNNNNNRVSPLLNMDTQQHKHNLEAEKDDITNTNISYSCPYSTSSSSGAYANNIKNHKAYSFHASTSAPSSSSSKANWNNKVGLLSHPQTNSFSVSTRNLPHYPPHSSCNDFNKKIITSLSKPISLLRRKCPCSDKKSVQVHETTPKPKTPITTTTTSSPQTPQSLSSQNQRARDSMKSTTNDHSQRFQFQPSMNHHQQVRRTLSEGFDFPLVLATSSQTKSQVVLNVVREEEETPRDSLQVFQPQRVMDDDDDASDASSDLFEIEAFSLQMKPTITEFHDFHLAGDTGGEVWWQRQRDAEVPPPLPML